VSELPFEKAANAVRAPLLSKDLEMTPWLCSYDSDANSVETCYGDRVCGEANSLWASSHEQEVRDTLSNVLVRQAVSGPSHLNLHFPLQLSHGRRWNRRKLQHGLGCISILQRPMSRAPYAD
jgi:hypothetical protein